MNKLFDLEKFMEDMSHFSSTFLQEGVTRLPFTKEQRAAKEYLLHVMQEIGMTTYTDEAGTVVGLIPVKNRSYVLSGSHYDSVPCGGKYDGVAGIGAALLCASELIQNKENLKCGFGVIAFNDEEGVRFQNGFLSSKLFCGYYLAENLKTIVDDSGSSIYDYLEGKTEFVTMDHLPGKIEEFIEVHVEQGPFLEQCNTQIGIVENIVGVKHFLMTFTGEENHAGTTSMTDRKDPVVAGSSFVASLPQIAKRYEGAVITCGQIKTYPGAVNVIASHMECTIDLRTVSKLDEARMITEIIELAKNTVGKYHGIHYDCKGFLSAPIVAMDQGIVSRLEQCALEQGYTVKRMNSGAGHDTQIMAGRLKTGMIFIPSKKGISHSPAEFTSIKDLKNGANLLKQFVSFGNED